MDLAVDKPAGSRAPLAAEGDAARPSEKAASKPSLIGLSRTALADALGPLGVPQSQRRMRAAQLWGWLYQRGAADFAAMTNIAKDLRAHLAAHFDLARPE